MRHKARVAFSVVSVVVAVSVVSRTAHADDPTNDAERLFAEAKQLIKEGKVEEACPKFEQSQRLDPGVGTQFNLADCYEKLGKFASAFRLFKEIQDVLLRVNDQARASKAEERARALEGRLPKLTIEIPWARGARGLVVQIDDVVVDASKIGVAIPLDPGVHRITVRAEGKKAFFEELIAQVATPRTVTVPELRDEAARVVFREDASRGRKTAALFVGGFGVAAIGTGIALGFAAKGTYDDGVRGCKDEGGTLRCPFGAGDPGKVDASHDLATLGTVVGAVGAVSVVGGALLWITAPRARTPERAASIRLQVEGAGVQLRGIF